jgi:hypothetical protein
MTKWYERSGEETSMVRLAFTAGASCSEEKLAILQCFDSNCLYGGRNGLQIAVLFSLDADRSDQ